MLTSLFEACPCIRLGFMFKSINLLSIFTCPSSLASDRWMGEALWFWWFSPIVILGCWCCTLLVSPGSMGWDGGSSTILPGLSPGNYRRTKNCVKLQVMYSSWKTKSILGKKDEQTSTLCLSTRYLPCVLLPPTWTTISHCKQRELPSISQ